MNQFVFMIAHRIAVEDSLQRSDLFNSWRMHKYLADLPHFWNNWRFSFFLEVQLLKKNKTRQKTNKKKKKPHHLIRAYVSCHSQRDFCEHRMSLYLVTSHPDCREKHFLAWRYIILFLLWVLFAGCGGRWQTITNWSDLLWLRPPVLGVNWWSCDWLLALKAKIQLYKHVTTPHPKGVTATGRCLL